MGRGDRGHDGKTEAGATAFARAVGVGAVKALEDVLRIARAYSRTLVRDLDQCRPVAAPDADSGPRPLRGVGADVTEEVVDYLSQAHPVAENNERLGEEVDLPGWVDGARGLQSLDRDLVQREWLALQRYALVEAGKQQQVGDEDAHALALAADPVHGPRQIVGPLVGAAFEELRVSADGGGGGAKFVGGVRDEPAQP